MDEAIDEILFDAPVIAQTVGRLADEIARDHADGPPLLLVGILKGAFVFLADLCRAIPLPVEIETMAISSYGEATRRSGVVRIVKDLDRDLSGRAVVLVEDIVDTGRTLDYLVRAVRAKGGTSVRVCALLDKPSRREVEVAIHYRGLEVPDRFVVGYGLDFAERYRNLPYIGVLNENARSACRLSRRE